MEIRANVPIGRRRSRCSVLIGNEITAQVQPIPRLLSRMIADQNRSCSLRIKSALRSSSYNTHLFGGIVRYVIFLRGILKTKLLSR